MLGLANSNPNPSPNPKPNPSPNPNPNQGLTPVAALHRLSRRGRSTGVAAAHKAEVIKSAKARSRT